MFTLGEEAAAAVAGPRVLWDWERLEPGPAPEDPRAEYFWASAAREPR